MAKQPDMKAFAARGGMTRSQVKAAVFIRDGGKCVQCRKSNEKHVAETGWSLEVHRKEPCTMYTLEGCVLLCRKCHGDKPKKRPGETDPEYPSGRGFFVRVRADYYEILKELAKKNGRTITAELGIALREYHARHVADNAFA